MIVKSFFLLSLLFSFNAFTHVTNLTTIQNSLNPFDMISVPGLAHNTSALETNIDLPVTSKKYSNPPAIPPAQTCPYKLGFTSLCQELKNSSLTIQGSIPEWLSGSFVAIGPGIFELNKSKAAHWLDGFGMLHQFLIKDGTITYGNKLIDSFYYQDCCKLGKLRGSTPEKKQSAFSKLTSALSSNKRPVYDNANINIAQFNNQLVALTETPCPLTIDRKTLKTKGKFVFDDTIEAHFASAHPLFDPVSQQWFGIAMQYAHTSTYIIYTMKAGSKKRVTLASFPVGYPAYMHSFGLTKNYLILTESPLIVSPYDLLLSDYSFIDTFKWQPKNGTNFIVVNRHTGKKVGTFKTEPFFTLHHVNAFEKNGAIYLDLIAYKDPEIITKGFTYKNLCKSKAQLPIGHLKRYTIDLKSNKVSGITLSSHPMELPHINADKLMHEHQYVFATTGEKGIASQLIKLDLKTKQHLLWHCNNCYTTEPIFVPTPQAQEEDDGVILSTILDCNEKKSFLVILDAKTMKEMARAYVSHHIPFTIHSKFFSSTI